MPNSEKIIARTHFLTFLDMFLMGFFTVGRGLNGSAEVLLDPFISVFLKDAGCVRKDLLYF